MAAHRTLTQDQINQMQELMDLGMTRNQARYRVLTPEERAALKQSNAAAALARKAADPHKDLIAGTRVGAWCRSSEFTITQTDVEWPSHCPVTGALLLYHTRGSDDQATLVRIDSNQGYIPGNVVVVSAWVAKRRGHATTDQLRKVVEFFEVCADRVSGGVE